MISSKTIQNGGKLVLTGGTNIYTINNLTEINGEPVEGIGTTIIDGDVINNGQINQALEIRSGSLITSADNIQGNIINNSNLTIGGELAKGFSITGVNGITTIDNNLKLSEGSSIEGILNLNNGKLNISDNTASNYDIGAISGSGDLALDVDVSGGDGNVLTDTISSSISTFSQSREANTITISDLNVIGGDLIDFESKILNGSNLALVLSEDVKNSYYKESDRTETEIDRDKLEANINWSKKFENRKNVTSNVSSLSILEDNQTLKYETKENYNREVIESQGDTLALINQSEDFSEKTFTAEAANDVYKVSDNLGKTAAGSISLIGVSEGDKKSTIDGNGF